MEKLKVIDLFCGIGGFSKGFEMAGYDIVAGIDFWDVSLETFKNNHDSEAFLKDLTETEDAFFKNYENKVDVIIAGPPCQGFSMCGQRKTSDKRNRLFEEVVRAVKLIKPKVVVIENVVGLLSMTNSVGQNVKDMIYEKFNQLGYHVKHKILDASEYGVPQKRKRVIFLISKIKDINFPEPYDYEVTVGDALSNIPDTTEEKYHEPKNNYQKLMYSKDNVIYNHEPMRHNKNILNRIKHVPQGGNWQDLPPELYNVGGTHSNNYRRLDPNKPSITLKHATKSMIIHPTYDRVVTAREVARLQSIPDDFKIEGNKSEQHQQLANAVPPLLGYAIATEIKKNINNEYIGDVQMSINPQTTLNEYFNIPKETISKDESKKKFKFIDLFSGIGGFRLAFESLGGECVFSSDTDKWANMTYENNFGVKPFGDITKISTDQIPNHDILCAGFPCQPFSIGGYRRGFEDTRGTLFFEIERILRDKVPQAFILENVKGLINHDKGNTFQVIKNKIRDLGYHLYYNVLNSKDYGIPQNRERIYLIGFKKDVPTFTFPEKLHSNVNAYDILETDVKDHDISEIAKKHLKIHYINYKNKKDINNNYPLFATEIRPSRCSMRNDGCSPCLTAKMGTGGNNVPIVVFENRKLTTRECLRLQGFPEDFKIKDNYSQSYKQIGNSVTVPVIKLLGQEMIKYLN